jgi:hypothetical protein
VSEKETVFTQGLQNTKAAPGGATPTAAQGSAQTGLSDYENHTMLWSQMQGLTLKIFAMLGPNSQLQPR